MQLGNVPNDVALCLAVGGGLEKEGHVAPVVGVSSAAGRNGASQVAGLDSVQRCATHAHLAVFRQAAGTHAALLAAHPRRADVAGNHIVGAGKGRPDAELLGTDEHLHGSRIR